MLSWQKIEHKVKRERERGREREKRERREREERERERERYFNFPLSKRNKYVRNSQIALL